jgi:hypothetical protein
LGVRALRIDGSGRAGGAQIAGVAKADIGGGDLTLAAPVGRLQVHAVEIAGSSTCAHGAADGIRLLVEFARCGQRAAVKRRLQLCPDDEQAPEIQRDAHESQQQQKSQRCRDDDGAMLLAP